MAGGLRIGVKIHLLMAMMAAVAVVIAALGQWAIASYDSRTDEILAATHRADFGQRAGALIYAVVMDSRGIYMARDAAEVKKFAGPMGKSLDAFEKLAAEWRAALPPSRTAEFAPLDKEMAEFIRFRRELIRLGLEQGAGAGRAFGDNDANRSNRQRLGKLVDEYSAVADREVEAGRAAMDIFASRLRLGILAGAVLALVGGGALALVMVSRSVAGPLGRVAEATRSMAEGRLDAEVPDAGRRDEAGEIARALQIFRDNMRRTRELEAAALAEREARAARAERLERRTAQFDGAVQTLLGEVGEVVRGVAVAADTLHHAVDEAGRDSASVAAGAAQAAANVEQVASAADELRASGRAIADRIRETSDIVREAVDTMQGAVSTMEMLDDGARRIGEVVGLISDIAAQTNLLALNATIEAARAGEAGKGFAVVANEVKNLANQTARATDDIGRQVAAMQETVGKVVEANHRVAASIGRIDTVAGVVAEAASEQGTVTESILRNVDEAAAGGRSVTDGIIKVSREVETGGAMAGDLAVQSRALAERARDLRDAVTTFLADAKAV